MALIYLAHHYCQCLSSRPTLRDPELGEGDRRGVERSRGCVLCHADMMCSLQAALAILCRMHDGFQYKFWVYILSSRTGTLYTGITGFFTRRILQHKYDSIEGFTKKYQCHRLVYYESH